jgi:mannitol operon transcriptional antiterminator
MELDTRLDLLLSSGTVSKEVDAAVRAVIARLADRWGIVLTEENGSRLVTHLAMALMRIRRGEPVAAMDPGALQEFRDCDSFPKAAEIAADLIVWAKLTVPDSEREYLDTNICLILEEA